MKLRTRVLATLLVTALTLAGCGNAVNMEMQIPAHQIHQNQKIQIS